MSSTLTGDFGETGVQILKYVEIQRDTRGFQVPLETDEIDKICSAHFHKRPSRCVLVSTGKFNTTYLLCFADRPDAILRVAPPNHVPLFRHERELLQREHRIQRILCTLGDVFPTNIAADFTKELVARDYVIQNRLPGVLWSSIRDDISIEDDETVWAQLAPCVAALHQQGNAKFGFPTPTMSHDTWGDAVTEWLRGMIQDMKDLHLDTQNANLLLEFTERGRSVLNEIRLPTLVHGDLWPKNILVSGDSGTLRLTGILDAERAFWGEPAAEWIFTFLDIPRSFWHHYGGLPATLSARFRNLIYVGRGAIQLSLEARRFNFDGAFAHKILAEANTKLEAYFRTGLIESD